MFKHRQSQPESVPVSQPARSAPRKFILLMVILGVFLLGLGIGDGRIALGRRSIANPQNAGLPATLDYSSVQELYGDLKSNYDGKLDAGALLDGIKSGLATASGNPYTEYLNAAASKDFSNQLSGSFTGIGAELGKSNDAIIIISPIAGFPAEKAGLKPKDIITAINGQSAANLSITDAVNKIRGPKGTKVTLKILRGANNQELSFDITRDDITVPSVDSQIVGGNIGYLRISRFGDDTSGLAQAAAQKFKQAGVRGVVLDLRGDPGGLLDAAVDVSSLWLQDKTVLQEKRGDVVVQTYDSRGTPVLNGIPTAVLIDDGSASASEITAGALHDNGAATLVGTKSFGKGSVQQLIKLRGGGELKVTIARWYTPKGRNIDKQGIDPDKKVERSDADVQTGRDPQKDTALNMLTR